MNLSISNFTNENDFQDFKMTKVDPFTYFENKVLLSKKKLSTLNYSSRQSYVSGGGPT